jgi:PhzF family phenazine biosynthesis protein
MRSKRLTSAIIVRVVRARPFRQVDVFATGPYTGNPVAVVLDGDGLSTEEMQRFTDWTNLSEATFVLPPTRDGADHRVRIFSPGRELPFAGHPTLGTCHAWLETHPTAGRLVVQECGAGLVEIRRDGDTLAFAAPPLLRYEPADEELVSHIASCLRIDRSEIVAAQWVDNGPGWVAVLLRDADAVRALEPGLVDLDLGVVAIEPEVVVRAFFPRGATTAEDPITGSLNASLARWLLDTERVTMPYVASQTTGRVHVSCDDDGTIWVGGATVTCIAGEVMLPTAAAPAERSPS